MDCDRVRSFLIEILLTIAAALYLLSALFLTVFVGSFGVLLLIYMLTRKASPETPHVDDDDLLSVTVQLPIYNESQVVDRLLDACARLDYPQDKLVIQALDDSTDCTSALIEQKIRRLRKDCLCNISHIRRAHRTGFKAGALNNAMREIETECVAIFDADFVPKSDFLKRIMPHFNRDPKLGLVQTRWDHLNVEDNLLTRAQALGIDAHFAIEQVARNRGQLPMSMNGTGGVWRVSAIEDAGGWSSSTLTEDLDLSYRAYMRGWRFLFRVDVAVPGELPPFVRDYKRQQARWAMGSTQCLIKHSRALLIGGGRSPLSKVMGLLHLAQYAVQPIVLMIFLLTPLLLWGGMFDQLPNLRALALVSPIPIILIALGQIELYGDWFRRLVYFPAHLVTGVAIVFNNSLAVAAALLRRKESRVFLRTPKIRLASFSTLPGSSSADAERHQIDIITIGESLLAVYAAAGLYIALETLPAFAPYMFTYAISFIALSGFEVYQTLRYRA